MLGRGGRRARAGGGASDVRDAPHAHLEARVAPAEVHQVHALGQEEVAVSVVRLLELGRLFCFWLFQDEKEGGGREFPNRGIDETPPNGSREASKQTHTLT